MCIIPFWLVDWKTASWPLGDCWLAALGGCWLAPGKAGWTLGRLDGPWEGWVAPGKAATAGCTRRLLAGVCWFTEFADFRWFCWFSLLLLVGGSSRLMLIYRLPSRIWLGTVVRRYEVFKNRPVTQSSRHPNKKKPIWPPMKCVLQVEFAGFNQF